MSGPGVGFEFPPQEVTWLKRDVLLFANSIGCTADELHFLYVRSHGYNQAAHADYHRNYTQTLQSSQHTQLSSVCSKAPAPTSLLISVSIQTHHPRGYRLLCQPVYGSNPWRAKIRCSPCCGRPATHNFPQASTAHLRRQDLRAPRQGHRRIRQGQGRKRG